MTTASTINNASVWSNQIDYGSMKNSCFQLLSTARRVAIPALAIFAIANLDAASAMSCNPYAEKIFRGATTCINEVAKCLQACDCVKDNALFYAGCAATCSVLKAVVCLVT